MGFKSSIFTNSLIDAIALESFHDAYCFNFVEFLNDSSFFAR